MYIIQTMDEKGRWKSAIPVEFKDMEDASAVAVLFRDKGETVRVIDKDYAGPLKKQPCYQCSKREPGCHGSCKEYKDWTAARDLRRVKPSEIEAYMASKGAKK